MHHACTQHAGARQNRRWCATSSAARGSASRRSRRRSSSRRCQRECLAGSTVERTLQQQRGSGGTNKGNKPDSTFTATHFLHDRFVVKTADQDGRKVFVNVCTSDRVAAPGAWAAGALPPEAVDAALEALRGAGGDGGGDGDAAPDALRFPVSVGPLRAEADKQGAPCAAVDVVVADAVVEAAARHRPLKAFLIDLLLDAVGGKAGLELDRRYKLPRMAYKGAGGAPGPHRIRAERRALVTEVAAGGGGSGGGGAPAGGAKQQQQKQEQQREKDQRPKQPEQQQQQQGKAATAAAAAAAPESLHHTLEFEGRPVAAVVVTVTLPAGSAGNGPAAAAAATAAEAHGTAVRAELRAGGRELVVEAAGARAPLSVALPFAAAADGARAELLLPAAKAAGGGGGEGAAPPAPRLRVRLPYRPLREWAGAAATAAPRAFGALPVAVEGDYVSLA